MMSLNLYFDGVDTLPNNKLERDVHSAFKSIRMTGCDYDKAILAEIECGQYRNNAEFVDRFNRIVVRSHLSTGTKAALVLYHKPELLLMGVEVGLNALSRIFLYCDRGNLLLEAHGFYIDIESDEEDNAVIDVMCRGRHFIRFRDLADYMMEDAPYDY